MSIYWMPSLINQLPYNWPKLSHCRHIFSINPKDLPNAMVIVQELKSNNIRDENANNIHKKFYERLSSGQKMSNIKSTKNIN